MYSNSVVSQFTAKMSILLICNTEKGYINIVLKYKASEIQLSKS